MFGRVCPTNATTNFLPALQNVARLLTTRPPPLRNVTHNGAKHGAINWYSYTSWRPTGGRLTRKNRTVT
jgi:hypothetical protein